MRFVISTLALACALPAAAYTRPLNLVRTDGADSALITTTPYLPVGQGDCSIYPYDYYGNCAHPAYDIGSAFGGEHLRGEPVRAAGDGVIAAINPDGYCGLDVFVDHQNGVFTRVCHLDAFADIAAGQFVSAGTVIGYLGSTGAGAPHLHFEARSAGIYGAYIDIGNPLSFPAFDVVVEPGPCDSLDYYGRCTGSFLEWCDGGQYFTVECAERAQTCGVIDEAIGNDCIDAPVEEQPVEEQPVEEQPVEEQPVDEEPIDEEPIDEEPIDEEPIADELGHSLIDREPVLESAPEGVNARKELPSSMSPSCAAGAGAPWLLLFAFTLKRRVRLS